MHLVEAYKILDQNQEKEFYSLIDKNQTQDAYRIVVENLKKNFPTQYQVINNSNNKYNYLSILLEAIEDFGGDTTQNPLLDFALDKRNTFGIAADKILIIDKCFRDNYTNSKTTWLHDERAYDTESLFKLKTLLFLSSKDAGNYGENPAKAIVDILKLKDDNDIKRYLQRWQSKNNPSSKKVTKLRDLQQLVNDDVDSGGIPSNTTQRIITDAGYSLIKNGNSYFVVLDVKNR